MLYVLAHRLRRAQEEITSLSLRSVSARLARRLLELAERHGQDVNEGIEIDLGLSRQELVEVSSRTFEDPWVGSKT